PTQPAPKMTWVHWVLCNIPPDKARLAETAMKGHILGEAVLIGTYKKQEK
ncbi:MAG TPA: YbhB/YbcL family Raf kinase inhibitor-like protein, partial [Chlorobaculum parvum]|nr:YbhB/YbcL family Raf kinase inhibitor-like protein [Chlorobaculum parvum]